LPAVALRCHPGFRSSAVRSLRARVSRRPSGALTVSFLLDADRERLRIPSRRKPRFADALWRHTCFEVFVARKGARAYREYNFSPSGEWAAYAFASYRKRADTKIPLARWNGRVATIEAKGRVKIGLSAVLEDKTGALSYWALRHPPGKPDFHARRAFALELA
jgi:hypothetical protein